MVSEKQPLTAANDLRIHQIRSRRFYLLSLILCAVVPLTLTNWPFAFLGQHPQLVLNSDIYRDEGTDWDWLEVEPSESLVFHPCYHDFQCARLSVPMNWNDTSMSDRVAIAIIKYPAKVSVTDPRYAGPILMNPGGPGSSGVYQVLSGGPSIQTITDPHLDPEHGKDGKYFDVIGFDPRGVGNTTPHLTCFPDPIAENQWETHGSSPWLIGSSEFVLSHEWARSHALGAACANSNRDSANIIHYMNSAQVVEDMVAIVDKHAEWRQVEATRLPSSNTSPMDTAEETAAHDREWEEEAEKLNYWGFSYGTILGQLFAAMHPDRVGRLVVDSVVDAEDYFTTAWSKNLLDTDRILSKWSEYCLRSGSREKCPSYFRTMPAGYLPAYTAHRTEEIFEAPIILPPGPFGPLVFEYHDIMSMLSSTLKWSYRLAEPFFGLLSEIQASNTTRLVAWKENQGHPTLSAKCSQDGPYSEACVHMQSEAWASKVIACSDGVDVSNTTRVEFVDYLHKLQDQSDILGTMWSSIRLACIGMKARPAWEFEGPIRAETANPIMFIGLSLDPVTPLRNAQRATELFPGSRVLQQNTEGHCSYSNPSIGTAKAVRSYFQHGSLPERGTISQPEFVPFLGCVNPLGCGERDDEDQKLWKAQERLALVWPEAGLDF
ncbi:TAP-like protein-domain-containing protein [Xylariomycetidae sp. FL2044]|nr:TAP-like protein-domain-containing protein [Xylariomycetidae sp. FL2044]